MKKTLKIVSHVEQRYSDTPQKWTLFKNIAPYLKGGAFVKSILEKSKEIYDMLDFLWSAFLRIYLIAAFSLAFMLNSFSLLSTFKNLATSQNSCKNLKPRSNKPKRECFTL